jgi:arsenate reductase-like glutaredoxin family protein
LVSPIILLTGRIDSTRKTTIEWLRENGVSYGITANPKKITRKSMCLIMRNDKNNLPNYVYKKNELYKLKALGVNPVLAFDDDDKCRKVFEEFKIDTIDPEIIMKRKGF